MVKVLNARGARFGGNTHENNQLVPPPSTSLSGVAIGVVAQGFTLPLLTDQT